MRILFLIAMLAAVGLVGWLWIESDSQPQRTVPTESASVIPDIQKLKELEDRSVLSRDSQSTEPAPALSGAARASKKAEEAVKLSAEKSEDVAQRKMPCRHSSNVTPFPAKQAFTTKSPQRKR